MKSKFILLLLILATAMVAWWTASLPTNTRTTEASARAQPTQARGKTDPATSQITPPKPIESRPTVTAASIRSLCTELLARNSNARRQLDFAKLLTETRDEAGIRAILAVFKERYDAGKRDPAEWQMVWNELVDRDARAAAALIDSYSGDPKWQSGGLSLVAYNWAKKDPQAASAWLASHEHLTDNTLDRATLNLMAGYAENNLSAATAYAMSVLEPGDKIWGDTSWVLTDTAMQKGGAKGLTDYFDSLPEPSKQRLFIATANRLGSVSLQAKMEWLTSQAGSTFRHDTPYREAAQTYAEEDPVAALKWVFSLPPSPNEGKLIGVGYASFPWMVKDLDGFTQYYRGLPPHQQKHIVSAVQEASQNPKMSEAKHNAAIKFLSGIGIAR